MTVLLPGVVVDDDGELIELAPVARDRAHELQLREVERQARHAEAARKRAQRVFRRLSKWMVRELQDAEVRSVFVELLDA